MESRETKPQVVMRNMRQFMSGMKNYLVTHGEREFIKEVESERTKVSKSEPKSKGKGGGGRGGRRRRRPLLFF